MSTYYDLVKGNEGDVDPDTPVPYNVKWEDEARAEADEDYDNVVGGSRPSLATTGTPSSHEHFFDPRNGEILVEPEFSTDEGATGITATPDPVELETAGTQQLTVEDSPNGTDVTDDCTYSSDDETVATVDSDGLVTADDTNTGTATITVIHTASGQQDTVTVNVS